VKSEALRAYGIVASAVHTAKIETKYHLRGRERERLAPVGADVWSVGVQRYSVQCKGHNLVGVTTVEEDATRGTTTLVYLQLHISLYTGTVHVLSRVLEYIR
jgi:hypothetical protein